MRYQFFPFLIALSVIILIGIVIWLVGNPLALLGLLLLPQLPLVVASEKDNDEPGEYDGKGDFGFSPGEQ